MKIPKPTKLPSGSWQAKVMVDGRRVTKTFATEEAALYWATGIKTRASRAEDAAARMTVGEALDAYIASKDAVLSPTTIRSYKALRKMAYQLLERIGLDAITQEAIQRQMNALAKNHSPKYVRNAHGLLTATLGLYRPSLQVSTTLPQKVKTDIAIPTTEEITQLLEDAHGTQFELCLMLAAWMGLRTSEIRGLTWSSVEPGGILHIKQAMVEGEDGPVIKATKTYSSDRRLQMPEPVQTFLENMPRRDKYIIHYSRNAMYNRLRRSCQRLGIQHYRFHDLRHYYASIMLKLGVPDKYAMEQMGHSSTNMLKNVYQHTMEEARRQYAEQINAFFTPAEK